MKTKKVMLSLVAIFMSVAFMTAQTATPAKTTTKAPAKECCKDSKSCTKKEGEKCCKETAKATEKKADAKKK